MPYRASYEISDETSTALPCAYIVEEEEFSGDPLGEIILHASLLASDEVGHVG